MKSMRIQVALFFSLLLVMPLGFALRDPTQPVAANVESDSDLAVVVRMIKFSQGEATANVSGKIVRVGDEVNGMKVVAIENHSVLFRTKDNKLVSVPVNHYSINKKIGENHASKK